MAIIQSRWISTSFRTRNSTVCEEEKDPLVCDSCNKRGPDVTVIDLPYYGLKMLCTSCYVARFNSKWYRMIELTAEQITEAIREYADRRYGKVRAVTLSDRVTAVVSVTDGAPETVECPSGDCVVPVDYNSIPKDATTTKYYQWRVMEG